MALAKGQAKDSRKLTSEARKAKYLIATVGEESNQNHYLDRLGKRLENSLLVLCVNC